MATGKKFAGRTSPGFRWLVAMLGVALPAAAAASHPVPPEAGSAALRTGAHVAGELLVKFRAGTDPGAAAALLHDHGALAARRFPAPRRLPGAAIGRWWHVRLPAADGKDLVQRLAREPSVERVEPNYVVHAARLPDDPRYPESWALHNTGQSGGVSGADLDAPEAWALETGSHEIVVAVIDTGVQTTHPDLAANVWTHPREIAGNGLDDDGNGYVDDVHGYDFHNEDADPSDDHGHGTHVAGTIGAAGNNATGIAGVNWNVRLMAVKFLGAQGAGSTSGAIRAVVYATDNGARVLNNSWGGGGHSVALHDAILAAHEADVLFVAAAGNSAADNDRTPFYPASYDAPNLLSVAATDRHDRLAAFSNHGPASVHLAAPGVSILSTTLGGGYGHMSGTSMAAPHAAGVAALLLAQAPARPAAGIRSLLMGSTDPRDGTAARTVSRGRLNAHRALTCAGAEFSLLPDRPGAGFVGYAGRSQALRATLFACDQPVTGARVTARFDNGDAPVTLHDDGAHGDRAAGDGVYAARWTPGATGAVTLTFSAGHAAHVETTRTVGGEVREPVAYSATQAPYAWSDVSGGTRHLLGDDQGVTLPIGFPVTFFGVEYTEVTLSSNGYLTFGDAGWVWTNQDIPDGAAPNNVVAALWDDLHPGAGGSVHSAILGTAPRRRHVFAWVDVPRWMPAGGFSGGVSFQIVLHEDSRAIEIRYRDVVFSTPAQDLSPYDHGASATVGVESADGAFATRFSHNQAALADFTALRFDPEGPAGPVADAGGPYSARIGDPLGFDGSASTTRPGRTLTYRWTFGDGSSGQGPYPAHEYRSPGMYRVELVVSDGERDSAPSVTTASVYKALHNLPPDARDDAATLAEDQVLTLDVLHNDLDLDNDHLLVVRADPPSAGGTLAVLDHGIAYRPAPDFHGTETFTYTVSDGLAEDRATVTVTVTPVNDAPQAADLAAAVDEDGVLSLDVLATCCFDTDGDRVSLAAVGAPAHGRTRIGAPGVAEYVPDPDFHGTDHFRYTVSDGARTATATVTVTVTPVPDAPAAADDEALIVEDSASTRIDVLANDSAGDGGAPAILGVGEPRHGTVAVAGGALFYTPDPDFHGVDRFTYTVGDALGLADSATVTVIVSNVNDPPVLWTNTGIPVAAGGSVTILSSMLAARDADNPPGEITYRIVRAPRAGRLSVQGLEAADEPRFTQSDIERGAVAYHHPGATGSDRFEIVLEDFGPDARQAGPFIVEVSAAGAPREGVGPAGGSGGALGGWLVVALGAAALPRRRRRATSAA